MRRLVLSCVLAAVLLPTLPAAAQDDTAAPPTIFENSAPTVRSQSAVVHFQFIPHGQETSGAIQFGESSDYGAITPPQTVHGDGSFHPLGFVLGPLRPATTYHYRAVATNASGTTLGPDESFTMPAAAPPRIATLTVVRTSLTRADVMADVRGDSEPVAVTLRYGTTTDYGSTTATTTVPGGPRGVGVTVPVTGLEPGTTYDFELDAQGSSATARATGHFTTRTLDLRAGRSAAPGRRVSLTAQVLGGDRSGGAGDLPIAIERDPFAFGSPLVPFATGLLTRSTPSSNRVARFADRPVLPTRYQAVAVEDGIAVPSAVVAVPVAPRLTARLRHIHGTTSRLTGSYRPHVSATLALLGRRKDGKPFSRILTTAAHGRFAVTVRGRRAGIYHAVVRPRSTDFLVAQSHVLRARTR